MVPTELTQVEAVTLAALSESRPWHGYELVQRVAELTDGRLAIRPGNLYRVLHRLEGWGYAREVTHAGEERRRYFVATARGRRAAAAELAMYARVLQRVPALREALSDA